MSLVREVVSSVDPNVRKGDCLDIKPYVKLKVIPGNKNGNDNYNENGDDDDDVDRR